MNMMGQLENIRSDSAAADNLNVTRVLVPVDLSGCTLDALRYARRYARKFGAVIFLLHVVNLNIVGEERGVPRRRLVAELMANARNGWEKVVEVLWRDEVEAMVIVREGRPQEVILDEAMKLRADLIIMGTHARKRWLRLAGSGTVASVLRGSPCPVLVARAGVSELGDGEVKAGQKIRGETVQ